MIRNAGFIRHARTICMLAGCLASALGYQGFMQKEAQGQITAGSSFPYFIDSLRLKDFSKAEIRLDKLLEEKESFSRYLISYNSDGLKISGMMNVPKGIPPFKIVIINHGFYDAGKFSIGLGFKDAADYFARRGYVALGSDLRNLGSSDKGDGQGTICDVLSLAAAAKKLSYVDKGRMGMWGYSGGGGLTLKAVVVDRDIRVAALFGSMSADETDNYELMKKWHPKVTENLVRIIGEPKKQPGNYARLSPLNYFADLSAAFIIHHGEEDKTVPLDFSKKLYRTLIEKGKTASFYTYPNQPHVLSGKAWDEAMSRTVDFFDLHLK
jgi:uncharacterized protein